MVLSGLSLLISQSGKNRKTKGLQGKNKYKKTTSCNTDLCVTQGRLFAIFLGSLRISIFALLEETHNERGYPEISKLFPLHCGKASFGFNRYIFNHYILSFFVIYSLSIYSTDLLEPR